MFRLQVRCSGGRQISVLTRGSEGGSAFPSIPMVLKVGALHCFGPRAATNRCCGDGVSSLVWWSGLRGACRPSNAHEAGRPVALKTHLAYRNGPASSTTSVDQPPRLPQWTSLLDYLNGPASLTTKMNLWTQYCLRRPTRWTNICDYGPSVPTNLTLKIFHRVVNLIFNQIGGGVGGGALTYTFTFI